MSHTYAHNPVHVVFSTKERRKLIPQDSQSRLWAYLAGVCKKQRIFVHEIGGMEDHLHMLIEIPLTLSFSDALQEIKTSSSRWMGRNFEWQRGFGVFGVSASRVDAVVRYIRTQETHHRKMTFEEEFIALLEKHGVPYDPRYVFGNLYRTYGAPILIRTHTHGVAVGYRVGAPPALAALQPSGCLALPSYTTTRPGLKWKRQANTCSLSSGLVGITLDVGAPPQRKGETGRWPSGPRDFFFSTVLLGSPGTKRGVG